MKIENNNRSVQNSVSKPATENARPTAVVAEEKARPVEKPASTEKAGAALPADGFAAVGGASVAAQSVRQSLANKAPQMAFQLREASRAAKSDENGGIPDGRIDSLKPADPSQAAKLDAFTANSKIYHVNGIGASAGARTGDGQKLANLLGKEVHQVHNNTKGHFRDIVESGLQLGLGTSNPPTDALAASLHQDLGRLMRGETQENITVSAHSQGGIIATGAVSEAINRLRKDGYSDERIRDVVSKHVQVNLLGSPANPSSRDPRTSQVLASVPPDFFQGPDSKPLSYFFGGEQNLRDYLTDGKNPPNLVNGPGFNTVRHPKDAVATNLYSLGRDDLRKLATNPFSVLGGQLKDLLQNQKEGSAHSLHGPTGYYNTILSAYQK